MGGIDECKDLIISLYVDKGWSIAEIKEELSVRGYTARVADIKRLLREVETAVSKDADTKTNYVNALGELASRIERLKEIEAMITTADETDVKKKWQMLLGINKLINDMLVNYAKFTGQLNLQKINIEKQEINVYQLNQALNVLLVQLVDENKIKIIDPELRDTYEKLKRRQPYDGAQIDDLAA